MSLRTVLRGIPRWVGTPWTIGAGVAFTVILTTLLGTWEVVELKLLDRHLRLRGATGTRGEVVVVGIGEDTFEALVRPWPLPRALFAAAVERIQAGRPRAVGLDLLFTEPSLFGPEDDQALAATLRKYDNVVLGALFLRERDEPVRVGPEVVTRIYRVLRYPVEALPRSPIGFVNLLHDPDGFVRRIRLYQDFQTVGRVESLAAQLARLATRERGRVGPAPPELFINFRGGERTFMTIPFQRVVRDEIPPETFAGRVVVVGATTPALHDAFNTPFTPGDPMPGVEIQANALDNLLRGDPLRPAGRAIATALLILAAALGASCGARFPPPRSFLLVAVAGFGCVMAAHAALQWFQVWIQQVPVLLALFGAYFAVLVSGAPFRLFSAPARTRPS